MKQRSMTAMSAALLALMGCSDAMVGPGDGPGSPDVRFEWRGQVEGGDGIEIKGINGNVTASAASGDEVEVVAVKTARHDDPGEVVIEVVRHSRGVTICARYPDPAGQLNPCIPGAYGSSVNVGETDVNVAFEVLVPTGVDFAAQIINGSVNATGLAGDVAVATINGAITIQTSGAADAATVNGSITASIGAEWGHDIGFATINGDIDVSVPSDTDAWVDGSTVNGHVSTAFPLTITRWGSSEKLQGRLGGGGWLLGLATVNGDISLGRGS
jgi:hypothetical protein